MMTHAYNQLYLSKCSRTIGLMLHYAVVVYRMDGADFLKRFIQSGIAKCIEEGDPRYIAGKSGMELYIEVMEITDQSINPAQAECYDRSPEYWIGWILAHYQWYSGYSFKAIIETISYDEFCMLYKTLHEVDVQKCYEVLDARFANAESRLKTLRKKCGLTQEQLSKQSGISLNTIRSYEQKTKDLNKAQFGIVMQLAKVLKCEVTELVY